MACLNDEKTEAIKLAKEYQQHYYELLPDWFLYDSENYELIRYKIGYALFGLPKVDKGIEISATCESETLGNNQENDIFSKIVYDKRMCEVIDTIYQQIMKFGRDKVDSTIYIGIIFNVILLQADIKQSNKKNDKSNNESNNISSVPIFKLKTKTYGISYIDHEARMYKTWNDYVTNNTLPQCTMILPKGGLYQYDPNYKVTEYISTAWIQILDSPACTVKTKVLKGIDITANTLSVATTIGFGVASMLTPIAPAVFAAGLIQSGICGTWIIARNSHKLVDFAKHKQSIIPTNKKAFPAWLGIGSTALSLGANGGTMLLSKAFEKGSSVGVAAKAAYNSLILSNLSMNGIGIVYQGYCLIDKYKTERDVDFLDIVIFTSHVLFFSNALLNTRLAGELIESSKGTIFEKFKAALRISRLKEEFDKMNAYTGKDTQSKSEGIVYKIKQFTNKEDFLYGLNKLSWREKFPIKYQNNNIVINNRIFIDPVQFTGHLLTIGTVAFNLINSDSPIASKEKNDVMIKLKLLLRQLLKDFYVESNDEQMPDINYFNNILQEMKYLDNAMDVLTKCFKITMVIVEHCNDPKQFLCEAIYFSWTYCKANLKEYVTNLSSAPKNRIFHALAKIVTFLYECIEAIGNELFSAFYAYMMNTKLAVDNQYCSSL
ncbi:uncharacterized protein LOC126923314 isoform X1 [Bombus affinis]|uniref:uncharacterized protein LOC126923314 isoform X1 n=2 Tax=Bombus affinis TaxID=309941 RepID=UPI0021B6F4CB|nr:uncharacterized protein LOC126923314 isoform X1 [Bombus affinis]